MFKVGDLAVSISNESYTYGKEHFGEVIRITNIDKREYDINSDSLYHLEIFRECDCSGSHCAEGHELLKLTDNKLLTILFGATDV